MMRLGAVIGTGFVLGPAFGGILGQRLSPSAPPLLAVALFLTALMLTSVSMPETAARPLAKGELLAILGRAERQWHVLAGGEGGKSEAHAKVPVPQLERLFVESLRDWRPHGAALSSADFRELIAGWQELWAKQIAMDPSSCLSWDELKEGLAKLYLGYKEARGQLHASGRTELMVELIPPETSPATARANVGAGREGLMDRIRGSYVYLSSTLKVKMVQILPSFKDFTKGSHFYII